MTYDLPSFLNRRQSRGKWYVSLRGAGFSIIKGFVGTRDELDAHIRANLPDIIESVRKHDTRFLRSASHWRRPASVILHKSASKRSKRRGQPFTITPQWVEDRLDTIGDKCEISGLPFVYSPTETEWHRNPHGPSLDRIKADLGYQPGNIRIVCTCVNISINEWGEDTFYAMCEAVGKRRQTVVQNR